MTRSPVPKLLVMLMIISQTIARSRSGGRSEQQPVNLGKCPTKCILDQTTTRLWKEVDGIHVEESYIENCETDCTELCLQSQDPRNTQRIAYMCGSRRDICNYEQNSDCRRHTLEVDMNKALPFPYYDGSIEKSFFPTFPTPTKFSDDSCPVCMKPDLSRLDCMQDVGRTEKCVDEDSCWIFPLSETIIVPIKKGLQVELDKIVKCYQDGLLQTGEGCKHEKCTGDVYRADEESGTMFSTELSTTRQRTGAKFSTELSTNGTTMAQRDGEFLSSTDYPTTGGRAILTERPTLKGEDQAGPIESTKQPTLIDEVDNTDRMVTLQSESKRVCNEQVQDCPENEKCFGRKMQDGSVEYECSALQNLECTGDDGCIKTCMPPYIPCLTITVSPTNKPKVTEDNSSINDSEIDTDSSNEVEKGEAVYVVGPDKDDNSSDEAAVSSTALSLTISVLLYLILPVSLLLIH